MSINESTFLGLVPKDDGLFYKNTVMLPIAASVTLKVGDAAIESSGAVAPSTTSSSANDIIGVVKSLNRVNNSVNSAELTTLKSVTTTALGQYNAEITAPECKSFVGTARLAAAPVAGTTKFDFDPSTRKLVIDDSTGAFAFMRFRNPGQAYGDPGDYLVEVTLG